MYTNGFKKGRIYVTSNGSIVECIRANIYSIAMRVLQGGHGLPAVNQDELPRPGFGPKDIYYVLSFNGTYPTEMWRPWSPGEIAAVSGLEIVKLYGD